VIYTFIEVQKATHRVSAMCRALKVSKSGFYAWRDRAPSERDRADALLSEKIARIHRDSRETYGAPRIHSELRTLGVKCARKRVARPMRQAGLFGCGGKRRKVRTTLRSQTERILPAPDLVKRNFTPEAPDRLWVADITYVRTWEGWLYLSFVLDTYSRRIVGWSMANNLKTELVLDALNMAIYTRRPEPGLIHHSDRGSQYTSVEFSGRPREAPTAFDGVRGRCLRQLDGRELRLYLQAGADPPAFMAEATDGQDGDLRVHRGLLQHEA
jgi:putative transposase